jgi:imidazoleglycerol-phosphate dehydratase
MSEKMRVASISRKTAETDIVCTLNLDGEGKSEIDTGVGFLDHMLRSFAKHGFFDLALKCSGDLEVDCHHTIEDVGIVLGQAIAKAVGDKKGIRRFGESILPMDEALILCAIDLSGRPVLGFDAQFHTEKVGTYDTQMVHEFFYAVSYSAGMNLHLKELAGENDHHIIEGMYKAFARALDMAVSKDPRIKDVLSTKGSL